MNKYLYGIIESESKESFGDIGVGNSEVYTVRHEGIAAVVSDIPIDYKIELEEAKAHEKVLLKVMETHTVIPMGFAVLAQDETEIKNILKRARVRFKSALEKMEKKLQINIKVSWDKAILAEILRESEEIRALAAEARERDDDQSLKIELGSKVKSALDERKDEYLRGILNVLRGLSNDFREKKITDQDVVMNHSFLVDQKQQKEFYKKLDELEEKYKKKLTFLCVGPLPPYNFTEIEIRRMNFDTLEEARKTLLLDREVSLAEINCAYEQMVRKCHPDLHPDDPLAEEEFKKAKKAHEVLTKYCEDYLCSIEKPRVEETFLIQEKTS